MISQDKISREILTTNEKINSDKLKAFLITGNAVHVVLKRKNPQGRHIFYNGYVVREISDTNFVMRERVLGEIALTVYEIKENGVLNSRNGLL